MLCMMVDDWGNPALVFIEPNPMKPISTRVWAVVHKPTFQLLYATVSKDSAQALVQDSNQRVVKVDKPLPYNVRAKYEAGKPLSLLAFLHNPFVSLD